MTDLEIARAVGCEIQVALAEPCQVVFLSSQLTAFADRIRQDEREGCAAEVPTSWLHPLMTGPDCAIAKYPASGAAVERLLQAVASAIRSRKP